MTFLLSSCVLWISTCISFLSADSIISVSARLNSTVLLPCQVKRTLGKVPFVIWLIGSEHVFERQDEIVYHDQGYEGRVDVPKDELLKGNCSLVLKNVRATDAGIYNCHMLLKHTEESDVDDWDIVQDVELRIDETPTSPGNEVPNTETSPSRTKTPTCPGNEVSNAETSPPRTNDAGNNSDNTLIIISSVISCAFIALLAIIAIIIFRVVLYRRRNNPSNQIALNFGVDNEYQVIIDT